MRVTVIDYKAGNLTSVLKALRHLGAEPSGDGRRFVAGRIGGADCAAGRGAFCGDGAAGRDGADGRDSRGDCARRAVSGHLRGDAVALCGIERSAAAAGAWTFCGIVHALCRKHGKGAARGLEFARSEEWLAAVAGVEPGEFVYFTHSYKGPVTADTAAVTQYIEPFAAAVERGERDGRAISSGKIGRDGAEDFAEFSGDGAMKIEYELTLADFKAARALHRPPEGIQTRR